MFVVQLRLETETRFGKLPIFSVLSFHEKPCNDFNRVLSLGN